jgi:hypothetical protein
MPISVNPYKPGTKMAAVFDLFNDGTHHQLNEVVPLVKSKYSCSTPRTRRTAGSFVRTLRRKFVVGYSELSGYIILGIRSDI